MKKRRTKKRYTRIADLIKKMAGTGWASNLSRIERLNRRYNAVLRDYNKSCNKNPAYSDANFKPRPVTDLLKLTPWYVDQESMRQAVLIKHATFCCPVTGEIMDMRDSFLFPQGIMSTNGVNRLVEKHGFKIIGALLT